LLEEDAVKNMTIAQLKDELKKRKRTVNFYAIQTATVIAITYQA
jgi:hypothetical protein